MGLIIILLIILLAAAISFYIVRQLALPPEVLRIALLVLGVIFLIAVIMVVLPLIGVNVPYYPRATLTP